MTAETPQVGTEERKRIRKGSGSGRHFNLDRHTVQALRVCRGYLNTLDGTFSDSVIVRRALRLYRERLSTIKGKERNMENELRELERAAKGVQ